MAAAADCGSRPPVRPSAASEYPIPGIWERHQPGIPAICTSIWSRATTVMLFTYESQIPTLAPEGRPALLAPGPDARAGIPVLLILSIVAVIATTPGSRRRGAAPSAESCRFCSRPMARADGRWIISSGTVCSGTPPDSTQAPTQTKRPGALRAPGLVHRTARAHHAASRTMAMSSEMEDEQGDRNHDPEYAHHPSHLLLEHFHSPYQSWF